MIALCSRSDYSQIFIELFWQITLHKSFIVAPKTGFRVDCTDVRASVDNIFVWTQKT